MPNHGDLKIWWIPQVPGKAFEVEVGNLTGYSEKDGYGIKIFEDRQTLLKAKLILKILGDYDFFLLENNHRCNYANVGGLMVYDENLGDWSDWYGGEYYLDITQISDKELSNNE